MKVYCGAVLLAFCISTCSSFKALLPQDEDKPEGRFFLPHHKPRSISIFSRPPAEHPDGQKPPEQPRPSGIISHLGNVLHGGSIGVEFRPLGHLSGFISNAKKILPGHDTVGNPSYEEPHGDGDSDHYEPHHQEPPPKKDWEDVVEEPNKKPKPERPKWEDWEPMVEEPHKKPKPERPRWEDIGEETYDDDGTGIIQPRVRSKRFIESKIYHVPLLYRSNARPFRVNIRERSRDNAEESSRVV